MRYALVAFIFLALAVGVVLARRPARRAEPAPERPAPAESSTQPEPVVPEERRDRPKDQADPAQAQSEQTLAANLRRTIAVDVSGTGLEIIKFVSSEAGFSVTVDDEAAQVLAGMSLTVAGGQTAGEMLNLLATTSGGRLRLERSPGVVRIRRA